MRRFSMASGPSHVFPLLIVAFVAGAWVERSGWLPGSGGSEPPGLRQTFRPFWETWSLVQRHYVDRPAVQPERQMRGAIRGMLDSLGDVGHTNYLTPPEVKAMATALEGQLEGIGARLSIRNGEPTVVNTIPGSPAAKAGLRPGDVLMQVGETKLTHLPLSRVVELIRGPAGTPVHLRVRREGETNLLDLDIPRAEVKFPLAAWHMLPGTELAHLALHEFGQGAHDQMLAALHEARQHGAKGLVVDVRGNPGGLKEEAVAVTSLFLKGGVVFIEQNAQGRRTEVPVTPGGAATDLPLVLLIDTGTASSAEIFAGAVQDHARGKLVGTRTFGTGTILQMFGLSDGSAVLLAVAEWLTPKGRQIWHQGIAPDDEVPLSPGAVILLPETEDGLTAEALAKSSDRQLLKAVELLTGKGE